jgi:DNA-binding CsgD family transcriptional regulator/DNA-binding transcriptional ArsR family regulator
MAERIFELLGVDHRAEEIYGYILREGGAPTSQVACQFDLSEEAAESNLDALRGMGLIARLAGESGTYAAVDPRFSVRALADRHSDGIARIRASVATLADHFDQARTAVSDYQETQLLDNPDAVAGWYARLQHQARHEFMAFDRPPYVSAAANPLESVVLDRGVAWRAIYTAASFETEGSWEEAQLLVAGGEQARVVPGLPIKLAIADRSVALVSLTLDPTRREAIVTESPSLVKALCDLFEFYWEGAIPVPSDRADIPGQSEGPSELAGGTDARPRSGRAATQEERALLTLIAAGLKDDVIARQLGMSSRTLRRRSQDLMSELGASNRFQAGVQAARRGWV